MTISLVTYSHGTTVGDLIEETEDHLSGLQRAGYNMLDAALTTAATTMTLSDDLDGIRPGAFVEIEDEVVYVRSTSSQTATIRRGMLGTTAAQHADEALVRVGPRFRRQQILRALRDEINSWPFTVYARYVGDLSVGSLTRGIDLDGLAGIEDAQLLIAQRSPLSAADETWTTIPGARLIRRQNLTDFPSGYSLVFPNYGGHQGHVQYEDGYVGPGYTAFTSRVRIKARFSTAIFSAATDLGLVLGMPQALCSIAPVGAAARLVMTQDIGRTDASAMGQSRVAEEVRPGDAMGTARALLDWRNRLIDEAAKSIYLAEDGWMLSV